MILLAGGIPLIYLGDEIGMLNEYSYRDDPTHQQDSRWVHRPKANWERYACRNAPDTIEGRVFRGLKGLIELRKGYAAFSGGELEIIPTENEHVLGFTRINGTDRTIIFANFSESSQTIPAHVLENHPFQGETPVHGPSTFSSGQALQIAPLEFLVFIAT